ncbi:MAG: hypothetical protein ACXVRV_14705 [Gaiellaceae bacterium]
MSHAATLPGFGPVGIPRLALRRFGTRNGIGAAPLRWNTWISGVY